MGVFERRTIRGRHKVFFVPERCPSDAGVCLSPAVHSIHFKFCGQPFRGKRLVTMQRLTSNKLADRGWMVHPRAAEKLFCVCSGGVLHGVSGRSRLAIVAVCRRQRASHILFFFAVQSIHPLSSTIASTLVLCPSLSEAVHRFFSFS